MGGNLQCGDIDDGSMTKGELYHRRGGNGRLRVTGEMCMLSFCTAALLTFVGCVLSKTTPQSKDK